MLSAFFRFLSLHHVIFSIFCPIWTSLEYIVVITVKLFALIYFRVWVFTCSLPLLYEPSVLDPCQWRNYLGNSYKRRESYILGDYFLGKGWNWNRSILQLTTETTTSIQNSLSIHESHAARLALTFYKKLIETHFNWLLRTTETHCMFRGYSTKPIDRIISNRHFPQSI